MTEGLPSLTDAFDAAWDEVVAGADSAIGVSGLTDEGNGQPPAPEQPQASGEHAEVEATSEHPTATEANPSPEDPELDPLVEEEFLKLVEEAEAAAPTVDVTSPDFLATVVPLDDGSAVTVEELRKSYLRQADYTRKTQEVAQQRQLLGDAVKVWEALQEDPTAFARGIAERFGLIEAGSGPVKQVDLKLYAPDEFEQAVQQAAEQRVGQDPRVQKASLVQARQAVNAVFGRIEQERGTSISPEARQAVIAEAARRQVSDLEMVYDVMLMRARERAGERKRTLAAAPTQQKRSPSQGAPAGPPKFSNVREAAEWALTQAAGAS